MPLNLGIQMLMYFGTANVYIYYTAESAKESYFQTISEQQCNMNTYLNLFQWEREELKLHLIITKHYTADLIIKK